MEKLEHHLTSRYSADICWQCTSWLLGLQRKEAWALKSICPNFQRQPSSLCSFCALSWPFAWASLRPCLCKAAAVMITLYQLPKMATPRLWQRQWPRRPPRETPWLRQPPWPWRRRWPAPWQRRWPAPWPWRRPQRSPCEGMVLCRSEIQQFQ